MCSLISIIVPIYKVEPYLRRCLDSIVNQTYTNLEIILVDDGSPDGCPAICDEYAAKDKRIVVIHKENGGLSDARNAGLDICKGEYISFVDSDDWVDLNYIKELKNILDLSQTDIAICEMKKTNEPGSANANRKFLPRITTLSSQKAITRLFQKTEASFIAAWGKIFKRNILETIRFPPRKIHEDEYVNFQWFFKASKIAYTNQNLYFYFQRTDSITGSAQPYEDDEIYEQQIDFFHKKKEKKIISIINYRRIWQLLALYFTSNQKKHRTKQILAIKKIKTIQLPFYISNINIFNLFFLHIFQKAPFLYIVYKRISFFILH